MHEDREIARQTERLSHMIFDSETTMKEAYQKVDLKTYKGVVQPREKTVSPPPKEQGKYIESLTQWKEHGPPPMTLFINQDTITRLDPRVKQKPYEKPIDVGKENAIKTRPRFMISPGSSLDEIKDPKLRAVIIEDTYQSTVTKAQKSTAEVAFPLEKNIKSPLSDTYAPPRPCDLPKLRPPYVSTEWRLESVQWDKEQLRGYADATKAFWLDKPVVYSVEREN